MKEKKLITLLPEGKKIKVKAKLITTEALNYTCLGNKKMGKSNKILKKVLDKKPVISYLHSNDKYHIPDIGYFDKLEMKEENGVNYIECDGVFVENPDHAKYFSSKYGFSLEGKNKQISINKGENNTEFYTLEDMDISTISVVPKPRMQHFMEVTMDSADNIEDVLKNVESEIQYNSFNPIDEESMFKEKITALKKLFKNKDNIENLLETTDSEDSDDEKSKDDEIESLKKEVKDLQEGLSESLKLQELTIDKINDIEKVTVEKLIVENLNETRDSSDEDEVKKISLKDFITNKLKGEK